MEEDKLPEARQQARELPHNPGCYLMRDKSLTVIYVGKAKDLHRRVNSYFLPNKDPKTKALVAKIYRIDHIITGNEYEAFLLENNLIKKYTPHYNIMLKDGKSYPVIRITHEPFPKVFSTRRIIKDGSRYFGPYPAAGRLETYLNLIESMFSLRRCSVPMKVRKEPCLYYHLGKCPGPCCGKVSQEEYQKTISKIIDLLEGGNDALSKKLEAQMLDASRAQNYELALLRRDQLKALSAVDTQQDVMGFADSVSQDYAAVEFRGTLCTVSIMQFRDSKLIGKALYRAQSLEDETEALLGFLTQYYQDGDTLPQEVYVSVQIDSEMLSRFFQDSFQRPLKVIVPTDGKHYRILRMARENARSDVEKRLRAQDNSAGVEDLKNMLDLDAEPNLIEGFDIAQLSGKYTVSSLISFKNGSPNPSGYRRFNIKSLQGAIDDYGAIREAVRRRYTRVVEENLEKPDLILIDGGLGQVDSARGVLDDIGLADIPVIGLAKQFETVVFDDGRPEMVLDRSREGSRILIAIRDECHRFATSANQAMRSKEASFRLLQSVDGVGPAISARLMEAYSTVDSILEDKAEDIAAKAKVSLAMAERILKKLGIT